MRIPAVCETVNDVVGALRVRAAVAAATKDAAKLDSCISALGQLTNAVPIQLPSQLELVQNDVVDHSSFLFQAIAVAEVVRAAVVIGSADHATTAINRLASDLAAVAPPTALLRVPINQFASEEPAFKKRLAAELNVNDEKQFASMFRSYRRHVEQLATAAEDRRLLQILLLSRIVRAGGVSVVQKAMNESTDLKNDSMLDELIGFVAVAAYVSGQQFPEVFSPDAALRKGTARFGNAQYVVSIAREANTAWADRLSNLPESLKRLDVGAGTEQPGLRQALVCELLESVAKSARDPSVVLAAISQLQNGVWKEEAYTIVGRVFADQKTDKKVETWITGNKVPSMEHIALLYGISMGILERPVPAPATNPAAAGAAVSGGKK